MDGFGLPTFPFHFNSFSLVSSPYPFSIIIILIYLPIYSLIQADVEAAFPQFIVPEDRVEYPKQVGR